MSLIEKIQNQSKKKRLLILWVSTAAIMIIVLLVWFFSFSRNLSKSKENSKGAEAGNLPSLFESIKKDFSVFKGFFDASVKEINDIQIQTNEGQTQKQGQQ
jgi:flagellar basal body-associated protein FliL